MSRRIDWAPRVTDCREEWRTRETPRCRCICTVLFLVVVVFTPLKKRLTRYFRGLEESTKESKAGHTIHPQIHDNNDSNSPVGNTWRQARLATHCTAVVGERLSFLSFSIAVRSMMYLTSSHTVHYCRVRALVTTLTSSSSVVGDATRGFNPPRVTPPWISITWTVASPQRAIFFDALIHLTLCRPVAHDIAMCAHSYVPSTC